MPKRKTIKEKKVAQKWRTIFIILCLIGFSSLGYIIFFSPLFRISNIVVNSNNVNCAEESQIKSSLNLTGQWIFSVDTSLDKSLKKKYLCIGQIAFNKIFPNKIEINLTGRQPLAVIKLLKAESTSSAVLSESNTISSESADIYRQSLLDFSKLDSDTAYMVDKGGVVFAQGEASGNIPTLFLANWNLKLGESIEDGLVKNAISALNGLKVLGVGVSSAKIIGNALVLDSMPKMILSLSGDINGQLASLQLILEEAKIEDTAIEFIDLRYKNPVVKYGKKVSK